MNLATVREPQLPDLNSRYTALLARQVFASRSQPALAAVQWPEHLEESGGVALWILDGVRVDVFWNHDAHPVCDVMPEPQI
jgi:hypothetical protein